jgi:sugar-specific transcriptional regulator TrmB
MYSKKVKKRKSLHIIGADNMVATDEDICTLNELGLSTIQARIYLTLAKAQTLTAHEISKLSGVARPHVYQALDELADKGLTLKTISKPEQWKAIPPADCISILMRRRMSKTAELQKKTLSLESHLKASRTQRASEGELQFMLIPKKGAVYLEAGNMLKEVKETMDFLCLTRRMIAWLSDCSPLFEEALTRKVDCRVIMPQPEPKTGIWRPLKNLNKYENFELRLIPKEPKFGFSIWDKKEILMTTSPVNSSTPAKTLWSKNKGLVNLCQEHFCCIWKKAERTNLKS